MSLVGKRLIVVGADWSDVSIGKLHASLTSSSIMPTATTTVTAWVSSDVTITTCTCTSGSTSIATVGTRSGSGTQASPFSWTITGVAQGTAALSVVLNSGLATEETKTLTLTVGQAPAETFSVSGTVTNGTVSTWPSGISSGGTATITVTPESGYSISTYDVTKTSGTCGTISVADNVITISNVTSNIVLNITCRIWTSTPVSKTTIGVTSSGTGRVAGTNTARLSTASSSEALGILVPTGSTIVLRGLQSGTHVLRVDYVLTDTAGPNPTKESGESIGTVRYTASNYIATDYFPLNADGSSDYIVYTNTHADATYIFWGFAGPTREENLHSVFETYSIYHTVIN